MITLLGDDQPVVCRDLRVGCALESDLRVVGAAGNGAATVALASTLPPDVVPLSLHDGVGRRLAVVR